MNRISLLGSAFALTLGCSALAFGQDASIDGVTLQYDGTCTAEAPTTSFIVNWTSHGGGVEDHEHGNAFGFYVIDGADRIVGGYTLVIPSDREIEAASHVIIKTAPVGGVQAIVIDEAEGHGDDPIGENFLPANELARWSFDGNPMDADCAGDPVDTADQAFPLDGEVSFEVGARYPSPSGSHYLTFQADGNLVVYTADDEPVWALNSLVRNWRQTAVAMFQADGNLVVYNNGGRQVWSALAEPGAEGSSLHLTDEGELQIVGPDGEVLWVGEAN